MPVLALLDNGSCSVRETCLDSPVDVHESCPQLFKCGTCVAWSPREKNAYGRNSGQCMLDRTARVYLDCNAPICPYYRPRAESPAAEQWSKGTVVERQRRVRTQTSRMGREAPPPTSAALARAAFRDHPQATADAGAPLLAALLDDAGELPVLLERFRGGAARLEGPSTGGPREAALEGFFARLVLLRRALSALEDAVAGSSLSPDEKDKIGKDLASIGGSMTTFNLLFKEKGDAFRGQGGKG